jgi:hypothetical protein
MGVMRAMRVNEETGGKGQRERRKDEARVVAELAALSASEASESERQANGDRGERRSLLIGSQTTVMTLRSHHA